MGSIKGVRRGQYKTNIVNPRHLYCSYCGKKHNRRKDLLPHIRSEHLNIRHPCTICPKKFKSASSRNKHQRNIHGISIPPNTDTHTIPIESLTQLSLEKSGQFPCMANVLSLNESEDFGIHVIAKNSIDVGHIVVTARPFAMIEYLGNTGEGCFVCGRIPKNNIKCTSCIKVFFCSQLCKANKSHRNKCDPTFKSDECHMTRLIVEIIKVAVNRFNDMNLFLDFCYAVMCLKKDSRKCLPPFSEYGEIIHLKKNDEQKNAAIARSAVKHVLQLDQIRQFNFNESKTVELSKTLFSLAYIHANSLSVNTFSEKNIHSKGGFCVRYYIFDALSRFNHSCDANLDQYLDDDDVTYCVTNRHIAQGDQLFINYLGDMKFENNK